MLDRRVLLAVGVALVWSVAGGGVAGVGVGLSEGRVGAGVSRSAGRSRFRFMRGLHADGVARRQGSRRGGLLLGLERVPAGA